MGIALDRDDAPWIDPGLGERLEDEIGVRLDADVSAGLWKAHQCVSADLELLGVLREQPVHCIGTVA